MYVEVNLNKDEVNVIEHGGFIMMLIDGLKIVVSRDDTTNKERHN